MIKKIGVSLVLLTIIPTFFMFPAVVNGLTLKDLYNDLFKLEEQAKEQSDKLNKTEAEIKQTQKEIEDARVKIEQTKLDIVNTNKEIVELEKTIKLKGEETKQLVVYLQVANGENMYLEYAMGAQTMADFIYRMSVVEQLSEYNDSLINSMNDSIEENNRKKETLYQAEKDLIKLQDDLEKKANELGNEQSDLYELYRNVEDEIANARSVIKNYEKAGCDLNDDLATCGQLPADTAFWRPLTTGYVTSNYGYRYSPLTGKYEFHEGIDLSNKQGVNADLYSVANGKVVKIFYDKWGGNQVVIHHYVNGRYYSSSYAHMNKIYVKEGDVVTKNTIVGKMGDTGGVTGVHLHIAISTGRRYIDYVTYSSYVARTVDPRTLINLPSGYGSWYNRTSRY